MNSILKKIEIINNEEGLVFVKFITTKEGYDAIEDGIAAGMVAGMVVDGITIFSKKTDDEYSVTIRVEPYNPYILNKPMFIGFDHKMVMINVEKSIKDDKMMVRVSAFKLYEDGDWFTNSMCATIAENGLKEGYDLSYDDPLKEIYMEKAHEFCEHDPEEDISAIEMVHLWIPFDFPMLYPAAILQG